MGKQETPDVNERITDRGDPQETSERHGRSGSPAPFLPNWLAMGTKRRWHSWTIAAHTYREPAAILRSSSNKYYLSYPTESMPETLDAIDSRVRYPYPSLDTALAALRILFPDVRITHE